MGRCVLVLLNLYGYWIAAVSSLPASSCSDSLEAVCSCFSDAPVGDESLSPATTLLGDCFSVCKSPLEMIGERGGKIETISMASARCENDTGLWGGAYENVFCFGGIVDGINIPDYTLIALRPLSTVLSLSGECKAPLDFADCPATGVCNHTALSSNGKELSCPEPYYLIGSSANSDSWGTIHETVNCSRQFTWTGGEDTEVTHATCAKCRLLPWGGSPGSTYPALIRLGKALFCTGGRLMMVKTATDKFFIPSFLVCDPRTLEWSTFQQERQEKGGEAVQEDFWRRVRLIS